MKKTLITIIATLMTISVMAQNNQLVAPATYVETMVDATTLQTLSQEFSIDKVTRNADGTFNTRIWLSYRDFDSFTAKNIPYTTVQQTRANVQMAQNYEEMTTNWNRYPTYSTYLAMMDTFRTRYTDLCAIDTILATTPGGHKILCAHISSNLNDNGGKPSIFYSSTIHGDEVVGYYMMLRLIDLLLTNYNTDTYITELVNNVDIWICPLHNPDGTYYASDNQINTWPISTRYNHNWEDLNRVFPEVNQSDISSQYEPEVEAMMQFMEERNFTLAANLHGGAEVFNYPWDSWMTWQRSHADADWWEYVGHNFADTCHLYSTSYMTEENNGVTEGGDWYVITGSMQDYHNWYLGTRHVTLEVCEEKVLSSNRLPNYWSYAFRSLLNFIAEADNGIHGIVTDSLTGEPIEALVYIENHDLDHSYVESSLPHGDYHRPIKAGQYAITYSAEGYLPKTIVTTISDGEKLVQNVQLTKPVGIAEYEKIMVVYPNPARDFIIVELSDGMGINNIAIYDIQGRLVETHGRASLHPENAKLDIRNLPAGVYFLHVTDSNNQQFIRKVRIL